MKLLITPILTLFLLAACVTDEEPRSEGVSVGDPLPQFEVTLNNGSTIGTDSLNGKVSMIIFFSASCPDCRRELPRLESVYQYFEDSKDVAVFAVSREEHAVEVESFWKEYNLTIPYSAQTDRTVYNLFAAAGVPRIYISDAANTIVEAFDDNSIPSSSSIIDIIEHYCNSGATQINSQAEPAQTEP